MDTTTDTAPVKLAELALELGVPVEEIEQELGPDVFRAGGFRCVTAFRASLLIEERDRRKAEDARRRQESQERLRAVHERLRARIPKGVPRAVPEGATAAEVMVAADGKPQYEGGTYRPVPSSLDWQFGAQGDGASIGPTVAEVRRAAQERAVERRRAKGGKK